MIVLDASVLIAHLDGDDRHHDRATELLMAAADGGLGASPITLAEVLVGPARAGLLEQANSALHTLGVATIPVAEDAPVRLALLRARTRLKLPDCCVLLAAETTRSEIATFDNHLVRAATELGLMVRTGP
ncbi:MAG: type II toxin-antitoxin system VapC family toxin [Acidimicrobiia bacterium]|nr:type II toxin-antitoxin system VapC family toxin [Acidimicrobiia bacterium]